MEQNYTKIEHELPLIPLRGLAIFPYMILNFDVGREISLKALDAGALNDDLVFLTSQKEAETDEPTTDDFYHVGTICKIKQMIKLPGNTVRVLVEGISRGKIKEVGMDEEEGYFKAIIEEVAYDAENADEDAEVEAFVRNVFDAFEEYINIGNRVSPEILISLADIDNVDRFIDTIAANIYLKPDQKQSILEEFDVKKRLELIYTILLEEIEILKIEKKITLRVKKQMNKVQKEYYLREQLKAIQKELGDDEDINSEADEYREKLNKIKAPKETKEKIAKEINKLSKISPMSPDVSVSRTYLDTVFSLPWNKETRDKIDLEKAKEILDDEHYGLEKVKERILEYLAIRKLSKSLKSPIICLVGPPGVGKTSLGVSIARALGRKFVKVSLGGVSDESEIRGHRRTYVGALPGKIVQGIRNAGVNNPLFLLDEIDKLEGGGYHGDPASAMLEVLDPEQNVAFQDNYLEETFDLSNVLFICTANDLSKIPEPLRDRLELIELNTYTKFEKMHIAKEHLINLELKENGIKPEMIEFEDDALDYIIEDYTREAGVRDLRRRIGKIMRKFAVKYLKDNTFNHLVVTRDVVTDYLGKPPFIHTKNLSESQVGVVNGLAYTSYGGEILPIEVNLYPGKGTLIKTGSLGDVMKESMEIAFTYVKSIAQKYGAPADFFETHDFHIHAPEGATPKDGPSAGVAISTAILSAVINKPLRNDVGMTGEVDLRGNSMTIGGLREKSLAAVREHLKLILVPKGNHNDVVDLPEEVKNNLEIIEVSSVEDVIKYAFVEAPQPVEAK